MGGSAQCEKQTEQDHEPTVVPQRFRSAAVSGFSARSADRPLGPSHPSARHALCMSTAPQWPPRPSSPVLTAGASFSTQRTVWVRNQVSDNRDTLKRPRGHMFGEKWEPRDAFGRTYGRAPLLWSLALDEGPPGAAWTVELSARPERPFSPVSTGPAHW